MVLMYLFEDAEAKNRTVGYSRWRKRWGELRVWNWNIYITIHKIDRLWEIAQPSVLWQPRGVGGGKEVQEEGDMCILMTDSCCMMETNTILSGSCPPVKQIKTNLKRYVFSYQHMWVFNDGEEMGHCNKPMSFGDIRYYFTIIIKTYWAGITRTLCPSTAGSFFVGQPGNSWFFLWMLSFMPCPLLLLDLPGKVHPCQFSLTNIPEVGTRVGWGRVEGRMYFLETSWDLKYWSCFKVLTITECCRPSFGFLWEDNSFNT